MASGPDILAEAKSIAESFLVALMEPDPDKAFSFMSKDVEITFTGATRLTHPRDVTDYNSARYKWVKKNLGSFDASINGDIVTVYSFGTLYGEWPDGTSFKNNRYIDRFEIRDGKIIKMDVLNDSAERILEMQANAD